MNKNISACFIVVGIIHLLPFMGVLGVDKINSLYGLSINDNSLAILMRHRAVLFALLGAFLCYAAFVKELQFIALIGAFVSVVSFILLAKLHPNYNQAILKVIYVDYAALIVLLLVTALLFARNRNA